MLLFVMTFSGTGSSITSFPILTHYFLPSPLFGMPLALTFNSLNLSYHSGSLQGVLFTLAFPDQFLLPFPFLLNVLFLYTCTASLQAGCLLILFFLINIYYYYIIIIIQRKQERHQIITFTIKKLHTLLYS